MHISTIFQLEELVCEIFSFLLTISASSILRYRLVCKEWDRIIMNSQHIWMNKINVNFTGNTSIPTKFCLLKIFSFSADDHVLKLVSQFTKLQKLHLFNCNRVTDEGLKSISNLPIKDLVLVINEYCTDNGIQILSKCTTIERLMLRSFLRITDNGLKYITSLTSLKRLSISHCPNITHAGIQPLSVLTSLQQFSFENSPSKTTFSGNSIKIFASLKNLCELSFCGPNITDDDMQFFSHLRSLRELKLTKFRNVTDKGLQFLSHLSSIQKLQLDEFPKVTDYGIQALSEMTSLTSLKLNAIDITGIGIKYLSNLTALKELYLPYCGNISDNAMKLLTRFTSLEKLDLTRCEKITNDGLKCISNLVSLKRLDLIYCKHISDDGLKSLTSLTSLERLDLTRCEKITDDGILSLTTALTSLCSLTISSGCQITTETKNVLKTSLKEFNVLSIY